MKKEIVSKYLVFVGALCLMGCGGKFKYWEVEKFNMKPDALKDNERIKVIYTSNGPDENKDLEFYIHVIVVSQESLDTVNVLTPIQYGFTKEDIDKEFIFIDQDNILYKMGLKAGQAGADMDKMVDGIQAVHEPITKVVRDPDFDFLADNNHPTVIGAIGTGARE
jgi:hypothetical protein